MVRFLSTVRYLKWKQIRNRIYRSVFTPRPDLAPPPNRADSPARACRWLSRPRQVEAGDRYSFLGETMHLEFPDDWNREGVPRLWLYNLHYFDFLRDEDLPVKKKEALIERWISENSPGSGVGWEPYPTSLRIVNWIKWVLAGSALSENAIRSLAVQARWLERRIEYHLLANHLFSNAKALVFAGGFFTGPEAQSWLEKGLEILSSEVKEQFLSDGAHFELSPTYHALATEDLLDLLQLGDLLGIELPARWRAVAGRAVKWLQVMTRPDGRPPLFNDAAPDMAPSLGQLEEFARSLGVFPGQFRPAGMMDLEASGYFRFEGEAYSLFGDAGPLGPDYNPGHGHADMLNFELFAHDQPVIVDTATSTYERGERRLYERGTPAHNTVTVDDKDQSDLWGAFRVGRRARLIMREGGDDWLVASHNGYRGAVHQRKFECEMRRVRIIDRVTFKSGIKRQTVARLHFHPGIKPTLEGGRISTGDLVIDLSEHESCRLEEFLYAPSFNRLEKGRVAVIEFNGRLETSIHL